MMRIICCFAAAETAVAVVSDLGTGTNVPPDRCGKALHCGDNFDTEQDVTKLVSVSTGQNTSDDNVGSCIVNFPFTYCEGTTPEETNWQQDGENTISVEVDASSCMWNPRYPGRPFCPVGKDPDVPFHFSSDPIYEAALSGPGPSTQGAENVMTMVKASGDQLKVHLRKWDADGNEVPLSVADAKRHKWQVDWRKRSGTFNCVGKQYDGWKADSKGIRIHVDTSKCGFPQDNTKFGKPKYFASLGGKGDHARTYGASFIYNPTPTGFDIRIREVPIDSTVAGLDKAITVSVETAKAEEWHIVWLAHEGGPIATDSTSGEKYETLHYSADGLCADRQCDGFGGKSAIFSPSRHYPQAQRWDTGMTKVGFIGNMASMCQWVGYGPGDPHIGSRLLSLETTSDEELTPFTQYNNGNNWPWLVERRAKMGTFFDQDWLAPHLPSAQAIQKKMDDHDRLIGISMTKLFNKWETSGYDRTSNPGHGKRPCQGKVGGMKDGRSPDGGGEQPDPWHYEGLRATVYVDTSHCNFKSTPHYFTNFVQFQSEWRECGHLGYWYGWNNIHDASPTGFRVHLYAEDILWWQVCQDVKDRVGKVLGHDWLTWDTPGSKQPNAYALLLREMSKDFNANRGGFLEWIAIDDDTSEWVPGRFQ